MLSRLGLVCLAAGCGRLEFGVQPDIDASSDSDADVDAVDAALGHDEDGDGLADAVDPCPHVPGDDADGDGDGVGDACDPRPALGGDVQVFTTLQPGDHPFVDITNGVQQPDSLRFIGDNSLLVSRSLGSFRFEMGFEILALEANPQKQLAAGVQRPTSPYYFAELNDNAPTTNLAVVAFDGVNGYVTLGQSPITSVHPGRGMYRLDVTAGTTPEFHVHAGWLGEMYDVTAGTPGYDTGTAIFISLNGIDVRLDYAVIVTLP